MHVCYPWSTYALLSVLPGRTKYIRDQNQVFGSISSHELSARLVGAGVDLLDGLEFSSIFVDEASQCKEPESLIPLSKLSRDGKVVLIGDLNQLPPTIHSNTSQLNSLLERIVNQTLNYRSLSDDQDDEKQKLVKEIASSIPISFLGTQYRMHPSVAVFPNW